MSRDEFGHGVKKIRPFVTDEEIDRALSSADADCEGFLVQEQFVKWLLQA
jgi:hypothetical protein